MKVNPFFDLFHRKRKNDVPTDFVSGLAEDAQGKEDPQHEIVNPDDVQNSEETGFPSDLAWQAKINTLLGKEKSSENAADEYAPSITDRRKRATPTREEIEEAAKEVAREIEQELLKGNTPYCLPNSNLLNDKTKKKKKDQVGKKDSFETDIKAVLTSKGIAAEYVEKSIGPKYTRYEYKVAVGTRLVSIKNTRKDIAFAVGASEVEVSPVVGKPSTVAIDIPNAIQDVVLLREAIESKEFVNCDDKTFFGIGKDTKGEIVYGSLPIVRGILLSGTTGSGKSTFLNAMIISILFKASPDDVRFILIDPKMVEFSPYNGIPHLVIPVVTDPQKAVGALGWTVFEMMKRYRAFADQGVKDLAHYNMMAEKCLEMKKLPSIVVLIDELDDIISCNPEEAGDAINRITQLGLAAGIYLIAASSKPKKAIVERMPSRIAFSMTSAAQSSLVIGREGAERLLGKGDMLYSPLGGKAPANLQGFYVSPEEIERVVESVKQNGETNYDLGILHQIEAAARYEKGLPPVNDSGIDDESDELLPAAVDVVLEVGQASVSMLQRRLNLGYSRAARLVDQMEERGYVGPFEGSKPRQILITNQRWQELKLREFEDSSETTYDHYGTISDIFDSHDALN